MLFYMQMKNWFLIFLMITMAYLVQQKSSSRNRFSAHASSSLVTLLK
ncbi:MAG: hypothetical protein WA160_03095 [Pseudobdellovibrio sp.]